MTFEKRVQTSILMTRHYPDLDSASDWLEICFIQWNFSTRFSDVISRENSGGIPKCRLFSQATYDEI